MQEETSLLNYIASNSAMLIAISNFLLVVVTIFGFFIHSRQTKKFMKKQHSFDVVMNSISSDSFQQKLASVKIYMKNPNSKKNRELMKKDENLRGLLNHMEGLSASLRADIIDEDLFKETYRGILVKTYTTFDKHIHSLREDRQSKKAYIHLEWLYERWKNDNK